MVPPERYFPSSARSRSWFLRAAALGCCVPALCGAGETNVSWFPTDDGRLAYQRFGTGERLLILLSGGPGIDPAILQPVADDLAVENTVVLMHQRGTGASWDAPQDPAALTVAGFVSDVDALRVALGLETAQLVGQSWGSMLSMAYAAAHRSRVRSLTLLNPGGPNLAFMRDFSRRIDAKLTPAERAKMRGLDGASSTYLGIELLGDVHERANVASLVAALGPHSANGRVFHEIMRDASKHYDVREALSGFDAPTLLLFGDDDPSLAAEDQLVGLFPQAQVVELADSGHLGWLDRPQAYRDALLAFVRTLPV